MKRLALTMLLAGAAVPASAALSAADLIVREAQEAVGVRYAYGRADERATDCAGLTRRAAAAGGVALPRTSREQFRVGEPVRRNELEPGDLVFFRNTYRQGISHVGVYIGEGKFVHAGSRQRSVVVDGLDEPYFATRFAGARRIVFRGFTFCAVP